MPLRDGNMPVASGPSPSHPSLRSETVRPAPSAQRAPMLADAPVLVATARHILWLSPEGEIETLTGDETARRVAVTPPLVCHARALARRLGVARFPAYDVLELFAFVHPAHFCLPTPRGLAEQLDIATPDDLADEAMALIHAARRLLGDLADSTAVAAGHSERPSRADPAVLAWVMGGAGWPWAPFILAAVGCPASGPEPGRIRRALHVWHRLPEWESEPPEPPPGQAAVEPDAARRRLAQLLDSGSGATGRAAEPRPQQADYASAVSAAFAPRPAEDMPHVVLAEAGTGVGKTLGYLAPASLWAEINKGPVWISTYTRNLQHQIDVELDRLHPDPATKARKVVVRKGRENYLCLLNFEDAVRRATHHTQYITGLGLMARWLAVTRDGDLQGGDCPGWLPDLLGRAVTLGLADRRGECIFSACDHYRRCFVEWSIRRARKAELVIANHALVMVQAALRGGDEEAQLPARYVFDEGHHVFDAADNAFAGHLTGTETAELRRWLLGVEEGAGRRSRARGLKRRLEDLIADDEIAARHLDMVVEAARALPGEGWLQRISGGDIPSLATAFAAPLADPPAANPSFAAPAPAAPATMITATTRTTTTTRSTTKGPTERFLYALRQQVLARAYGREGPFSLEVEPWPLAPEVAEAAAVLAVALAHLAEPLAALAQRLEERLSGDAAAELEVDQRRRLDAMARSLSRRGAQVLDTWRAMLAALLAGETPPGFVDWFAITRNDGRDCDIGFFRHYIDPTVPFVRALVPLTHGMVITSATLTDGTGDPERDWEAAEARTGALHLVQPPIRASVLSPFDYPGRTRVVVVTDVRKDDLNQVAAAYRELFLAAGGGGLGLFTAIGRLRAVHERIADPLAAAGLPLYAQHIDPLDTATLIDIFRGEEHACLLGTDAVRDGVDVPGRSLHLIVFDRVPWPRPDILHRARREAFGGRSYDDMIVRLRLKQAFGRLVRRADDRGVFVLLDGMMPSRLAGAFPEGVLVQRIGLAEAAAITRTFLQPE